MINFKYKFIFCHNEKAAGTSIGSSLMSIGSNQYISNNFAAESVSGVWKRKTIDLIPAMEYDCPPNQHMQMSRYKQFFNIDDFFTFGFVRNPMDRAFSLYIHQAKLLLDDQSVSSDFIYNNQDKVIVNVDDTRSKSLGLAVGKHEFNFEFFIKVYLLKFGSLQHKQFCDKDNKILCKFIGRFENLQEDWHKVCDKIGIKRAKLPTKNVSNIGQHTYNDFFTSDLKEFFIENYKDEFEVFGYEKG